MAKETFAKETFQVPPEMRALAEQSVEQARKAFEGVMAATHQTVASFEGQAVAAQAGARDMTRKAAGFAEKNVAASFEFARRLVQAKGPDEMVALHADYVKAQMQALQDQAQELGRIAADTASEAESRAGPTTRPGK